MGTLPILGDVLADLARVNGRHGKQKSLHVTQLGYNVVVKDFIR